MFCFPPLRIVCSLQDEAAEGHVVGLDLATGEPLDPVTCAFSSLSPADDFGDGWVKKLILPFGRTGK